MWSYTFRRTVGALPTLFVLCLITFLLMRVAPGGPFSGNRKVPPEVIKAMEDTYHLNDPIWLQFWNWFYGVLHFDLGPSLKLRDYNVSELIAIGLPTSIEVGAWAMLLSTIVGLALGIAGALRRNGPIDYSVGAIAMVGVAVPIFVIGPVLQIVFGLQLGWLPIARWDNSWQCRILPVVTLALPNIAYVSRLMRSSMIEVARTNYVRTARAKGIGERRTILKHALRGAIMPIVAYLGPATAVTIAGSVVVETVFSIPGIGRYFVQGVENRDYPLIMGVTLLYGAIVIAANLVTDIVRGLLDPKVSYE